MKFSLRHLSTGKVYVYMEPFVHLAARGFFRHVYVNNRHGVLPDKPVLLAANHPTAFIDPILLCIYLDPPIYNMTRGDVFKKPFYRKLLESANMFPVFRVRDGYASRDRNNEVFEYCIDKLDNRQVVTIYVEGEHHLDKHVRTIQKGLARIAFAAYERLGQEDLQVIPAGTSYHYGDRAREEVMLNVGTPLFIRDYWSDYQDNAAQAIQRLCNDLETALKSLCLHVEDEADYRLVEQLLTLHRSDHPTALLPVVKFDHPRFAGEKAVCDRLNAWPAGEKEVLRDRVKIYCKALDKAGLHDEALVNPGHGNWSWLLFFLAGLLPFLIGWISCWPVRALAYWVADKKVKKKEFYGSVIFGVGLLGGQVYYLLLFLISLLTGRAWWIGLALLLPLLGWFSVFYGECWERWRGARKAAGHPERAALLRLRGEIGFE